MSHELELKKKLFTKLGSRFPAISKKLADGYQPIVVKEPIPWTKLDKPISESRVALITTAGIHHASQQPFDLQDEDGDPTFRILDGSTLLDNFIISHDSYDHTHAEKDPNVVFPLERLKEFEREGTIGELAPHHYGFMGHILGKHLPELVEKSAVEVAAHLKNDQVDLVILTPA